MTSSKNEITSTDAIQTDERLAVGFVATDGDIDRLLRGVVRAQNNGYDCIVVARRSSEPRERSLLTGLGAMVVTPQRELLDDETLEEVLVGIAQAESYRGLILAPSDGGWIDFDRSAVEFATEDQFLVEATTRTSVSRTLAAIPAYNEAQSIARIVRQVSPHVDGTIVVDDGSGDETGHHARCAGAEVISHPNNRGYGAALKTAFDEAAKRGADHLVVLDGDGQHDPDDIPKLVDELESTDADIVIGSRFVADSTAELPHYRRFGLFVINLFTNLSMGAFRPRSWIRDTQSGFRAYSTDAIESLATTVQIDDHMSASTDILYHARENDYTIREIETEISYDVENPNSINPIVHGLLLMFNIFKELWVVHSEKILAVLGIVCIAGGLGTTYWITSSSIDPNSFPLSGIFVAGMCILAGVLACFTAIVRHSLMLHTRDIASTGDLS